MRSSQKTIASLISQIRQHLGAKTTNEAWHYVWEKQAAIKEWIQKHYDAGCIRLTPYADSSWKLCAVDSKYCGKGQVRCPSVNLTAEEIVNKDAITLAKILVTERNLEPLSSEAAPKAA
jgi:hypothetical protein